MRIGLQVPNFTWPNGQSQLGDTFAHIARQADRAGFYSFWVMDHFFQIRTQGPPDHEMLQAWSAPAFAAGATNHTTHPPIHPTAPSPPPHHLPDPPTPLT